MCFLHRKIEFKLSGQAEKAAKGDADIKLLNHSQLQKEIEKFGDGYKVNDSFSFLKEAGLGAHLMLQTFSKKSATDDFTTKLGTIEQQIYSFSPQVTKHRQKNQPYTGKDDRK